jgi:hypothetical protein
MRTYGNGLTHEGLADLMHSVLNQRYNIGRQLYDLVFASCEDTKGPVMSSDAQPPSISAPSSGDNFILTEEDEEQDLFTLQWSAPDFGFPAAVNCRVQLDPHGGDFSDPVNLGDVNSTSFTVTVVSLNTGSFLPDGPAESNPQ